LRDPELETVFKNVPNNRFFLETDTVEENIEVVYALAAKYKGVNLEEIQRQINSNFQAVFKKSLI
jgi:TatD DNase family protein